MDSVLVRVCAWGNDELVENLTRLRGQPLVYSTFVRQKILRLLLGNFMIMKIITHVACA